MFKLRWDTWWMYFLTAVVIVAMALSRNSDDPNSMKDLVAAGFLLIYLGNKINHIEEGYRQEKRDAARGRVNPPDVW